MTKNKNFPRDSRNYDPNVQKQGKSERLRKAARVVAGAAAVTAVATTLGIGLAEASKGHTGPKHNKATEVAIENVIKPKMTKIAVVAQGLAEKPDVATRSQVGETVDKTTGVVTGITQIYAFSPKTNDSLRVVMNDYPGTNKPNPSDVLVVDMITNSPLVGPDNEVLTEEVMYMAPNSSQYNPDLGGSPYPIDKEGWTALDFRGVTKNGVPDPEKGGVIDTASREFYGTDSDYEDVTSPVTAAQNTIARADEVLQQFTESLSAN
ncbi:MAG TPA: hypothetical protein VLG92_00730 [Candidatus Saccharimonadia bacterium]|nr:hypothetical protein [Candidatus Saccharimonadia bacterium]